MTIFPLALAAGQLVRVTAEEASRRLCPARDSASATAVRSSFPA